MKVGDLVTFPGQHALTGDFRLLGIVTRRDTNTNGEDRCNVVWTSCNKHNGARLIHGRPLTNKLELVNESR